jgi:hypothetical protein
MSPPDPDRRSCATAAADADLVCCTANSQCIEGQVTLCVVVLRGKENNQACIRDPDLIWEGCRHDCTAGAQHNKQYPLCMCPTSGSEAAQCQALLVAACLKICCLRICYHHGNPCYFLARPCLLIGYKGPPAIWGRASPAGTWPSRDPRVTASVLVCEDLQRSWPLQQPFCKPSASSTLQ